jgi:catechol 2,3-dioxygenase-like lactoylglutathione lyase family enzyme
MELVHLGLPVRDVQRSLAFYAAYFGFDPATATHHPDGTVIVRDANRFDLALHVEDGFVDPAPATDTDEPPIGPLHPFPHFGFRLSDPREVQGLLTRLQGDGVRILENHNEPGYVAFKCADPDGHRVEVYWEG